MKTWVVVVGFVLSVVQVGSGQMRGLGFIQGKVLDERGAALGDVAFTATLARVGDRLEGASNQRGEWRVIGMSHGDWDITFVKSGYLTQFVKVTLETELSRIPALTIRMTPNTH